MKYMHLKREIAQLELSDLGRGACLHANHASRKPQSFESIITKRLRPAIMCSFRC
jgi:hypothetical protein